MTFCNNHDSDSRPNSIPHRVYGAMFSRGCVLYSTPFLFGNTLWWFLYPAVITGIGVYVEVREGGGGGLIKKKLKKGGGACYVRLQAGVVIT